MEEYIALYKSLDRDLLSMNRQCAQELEHTQQELMELLGGFELPPPSLPNNDKLIFLAVACRFLQLLSIVPQSVHSFLCCLSS